MGGGEGGGASIIKDRCNCSESLKREVPRSCFIGVP